MSSIPLCFHPSLERPEPDEAETPEALIAIMRSIAETTFRDYGHAVRSVHAKSHALLEGELTVLDGLPAELAQGMFARQPVEGERLPGAEGAVTQDFVLANAPAFAGPDAKAFLKNIRLLAATTDRAEDAKVALSVVLRGVIPDLSRRDAEPNVAVRPGELPLTTAVATASAASSRAVKPVLRNCCTSPRAATILRARATGRMGGSTR